jgi:predicted transposase/invertase (TIGR01784 family)
MLMQEWNWDTALETRFTEGFERGVDRNSVETARRMLYDGINHETIAKYTGLSIEKIKSLTPLPQKEA